MALQVSSSDPQAQDPTHKAWGCMHGYAVHAAPSPPGPHVHVHAPGNLQVDEAAGLQELHALGMPLTEGLRPQRFTL